MMATILGRVSSETAVVWSLTCEAIRSIFSSELSCGSSTDMNWVLRRKVARAPF